MAAPLELGPHALERTLVLALFGRLWLSCAACSMKLGCVIAYLFVDIYIYVCIYIYICIYIHIYIYLAKICGHPSAHPSICLSSIYPSIYLSIFLSIHLSVYQSIHLSTYLSIYRYILSIPVSGQLCISPPAQVSIDIRQVFAVEIEEFKRNFILEAFGDHVEHIFDDVEIFAEEHGGRGFCFKCCQEHLVPQCDILLTGPSCKNLSKQFLNRKDYTTCSLDQRYNMYIYI